MLFIISDHFWRVIVKSPLLDAKYVVYVIECRLKANGGSWITNAKQKHVIYNMVLFVDGRSCILGVGLGQSVAKGL